MFRLKKIVIVSVFILISCQALNRKGSQDIDNLINSQLSPLVDSPVANGFPSLSALVVNGKTSQTLHLGKQEFDDNKLFELGGITTIFTAFLFAQLEQDKRLVREDFIKDLFPSFGMPPKIEDSVQLKHLLAHSSGMPIVPKGFIANTEDPFARYNFKKMFLSMRKTPLLFYPNERTSFSHLGYSLLGYGLAASMETNYTEALSKKVLEPFGMKSSTLNIPSDINQMVKAYTSKNEAYKYWAASAFAPAVGLKTNLNDIQAFINYQINPPEDLKGAVLKSRDILISKGQVNYAYGWQYKEINDRKIYWLNGITYGFTSVIILEPGAKKAIFVVANKRNVIVQDGKSKLDNRMIKKAFHIIESL